MKATRSIKPVPARSAQAGFSLIEIIIVVVLIGGIVAFAATKIMGQSDNAKHHLAESQVQSLAEKVQQFQTDTGRLPTALDELVKEPSDASGWLGPYWKEKELKDPWGHAFEYRAPGTDADFDLISYGKDGKPGGSSVDGDIKYE